MSDRHTRRIASERTHRNRFSSTHEGVLENPDLIDQIGVFGERVFAEEFGIPLHEIVKDHKVPYNFVLTDGTRVDVRTSTADKPSLLVPPSVAKRTTIDVFVLVEADRKLTKGKIVGWATRADILEKDLKKASTRPNARPVHKIDYWSLRDIDLLRQRHILHMEPLFNLDGLAAPREDDR